MLTFLRYRSLFPLKNDRLFSYMNLYFRFGIVIGSSAKNKLMSTLKMILISALSAMVATGCAGKTETTSSNTETASTVSTETVTAANTTTTAATAVTASNEKTSTETATTVSTSGQTSQQTTANKTVEKQAKVTTTGTTKPTTNITAPTAKGVPQAAVVNQNQQQTNPVKTEVHFNKQGNFVPNPTNANQSPPQAKQLTGGKVNLGKGNNSTPTPPHTGGKVVIGGGGGGGGDNNQNTGGGNHILDNITEGDASSAIKEALMKGVQVGVDKVSITDGYFKNSIIKIPFPAQVKQVESALRSVGMGSVVDNAVLSMNRAAESAAKQAGPIFLNSIKQMTINDAVNIVSNQQPDAATQFLERTSTESLVGAFKPSIKTALDKTLATKYWSDITGYYNKLPFVNPISTDLPDYVTRKAIDGLFYMVAQEEAKIRKDPMGETNKIIKDVFGKVKF